MQCSKAHEQVSAYLDGALSTGDRAHVARHLEACEACRAVLADYERARRAVQSQGRMPVPSALKQRLLTMLDHEDEQIRMAHGHTHTSPVDGGRMREKLGRVAARMAALAAVCIASVGVTWWAVSASNANDRVEREVLNAHIRSLLQETPVQVASSDQHTVRPWFAGRTDFAPAVKDLAADGFPLIGGRLDYAAERRVGVIVYRRRLHTINVFMWPAVSQADTGAKLRVRNGYNLISWTRSGVSYWAVSDLTADELRRLYDLM